MFPIQKGKILNHNIGTKATTDTKCTFDIQAKNLVCSCLQIVMGKEQQMVHDICYEKACFKGC